MGRFLAFMAIFVEYPWLAAAVGVALIGLGRWRGRRIALVAGGLWLLYALYETGMRLRWLCTGECNIRLDLMLIYPVLFLVSVAAGLSLFRGRSAVAPRP